MIDKDGKTLMIGECGPGQTWKMALDLEEIAKGAGVRKRVTWKDPATGTWYKEDCTPIPLPRARRIISLILKYAEPEDLEAVDRAFRTNEKLYKIWKEKLGRLKV